MWPTWLPTSPRWLRTVPDLVDGRCLTSVLLEPVDGTDDVPAAVRSIPRTLAALAVSSRGAGPLRLTDHDIRSALSSDGSVATGLPFSWSARTARRALGLDAVRSLLSGEAKTPAHAVGATLARMARVRSGDRPSSSMEVWVAGLPAGARSAAEAEAVTWATRLWNALDWTAFPSPPLIGRDHWWDSPHSSLLALRSRAEVRSVVPGEQPATVHLVVLGGTRRPTVRSELCVVALVEALRAGRSAPPGRVVGWWPDSGHIARVDVNRAALDEGVAAVAQTLGTGSPRARTGGGTGKAA